MDVQDITDLINDFHAKEELLENKQETGNVSLKELHELGVTYFQLGNLYEILAQHTNDEVLMERAQNYLRFSKTEFNELGELAKGQPAFLYETKRMLQYLGEEIPAEIQSAIQDYENTIEQDNRQPFWKRFRNNGGKNKSSYETISDVSVWDAVNQASYLEKSLEVSTRASEREQVFSDQQIARKIFESLHKALYVASLDDWEIECGVEGEYLREILPEEEFEDILELKRKIDTGEISVGDIPSEKRQFQINRHLVLPDQKTVEYIDSLEKKQAYLSQRVSKVKNPSQKEALMYMMEKVETELESYMAIMQDPEIMINSGLAVLNDEPTDIGTSKDRKEFYAKNCIVSVLREYVPVVEKSLGNGNVKNIEKGWHSLCSRYPIFGEMEEFGIADMASMFKETGYQNMEDAIRALIVTSEGTPAIQGNRFFARLSEMKNMLLGGSDRLTEKVLDYKR